MMPSVLNPRVQAGIALALVLMLAGVIFLPAIVPTFSLDPDTRQILFTLVTVAVSYYLGSSSSSARKDNQIAALTSQQLTAPDADPAPQATAPFPPTPKGST